MSCNRGDRLSDVCLQAWAENKVPMMPPSADLSKDRNLEQKVEGKKKTQAELEQEMAALQYTNPHLLEVNTKSTRTDQNQLWALAEPEPVHHQRPTESH